MTNHSVTVLQKQQFCIWQHWQRQLLICVFFSLFSRFCSLSLSLDILSVTLKEAKIVVSGFQSDRFSLDLLQPASRAAGQFLCCFTTTQLGHVKPRMRIICRRIYGAMNALRDALFLRRRLPRAKVQRQQQQQQAVFNATGAVFSICIVLLLLLLLIRLCKKQRRRWQSRASRPNAPGGS
jgi:hypothetical protein